MNAADLKPGLFLDAVTKTRYKLLKLNAVKGLRVTWDIEVYETNCPPRSSAGFPEQGIVQGTLSPIQVGQVWRHKSTGVTLQIFRYDGPCSSDHLWIIGPESGDTWAGYETAVLNHFDLVGSPAASPSARKGNGSCTLCRKDAFVMFSSVECFNPLCRFYKPSENVSQGAARASDSDDTKWIYFKSTP